MAVTDSAVQAWLDANPNASDADIAEAAKSAGVDSTQLERVTGISKDVIEDRASAVGVDLASTTTEAPEPTQADTISVAEPDADAKVKEYFGKDINKLSDYFFQARQAGEKVNPDYLTDTIGYSYDDLVLAQGVAMAKEERDKLLAEGNTELADAFTQVLETQPPAAAYGAYIDYKGNDNFTHEALRDETLAFSAKGSTGDRIGDPGQFNNSGINKIADPLKAYGKALLEDPGKLALAAITLWNPALGSMLSAGTKIVEGEGLDFTDLASLAINAPGIADNISFANTALGGGDLGAGMLTDQSIMNAFQNYGLEGFGTAELIAQAGGSTLEAMQAVQDIPQTALNKLKEVPEIQTMIAGAPIDIQNDLLRGMAQGAVAAGGTAILGGSGTDIAKAFLKQQNVDLGLEGVGKNIELAGKGMLADLGFEYTGPDLADVNYDSLNNLSNITLPSFGGVNIPSVGTPSLGLPPYTGPDLADVNYDSLNNLSNINIGNLPDFDVTIPFPEYDLEQPTYDGGTTPSAPSLGGIDIPTIPMLTVQRPPIDVEQLDVVRGGRGMFGSKEEDVKRISELLLAGAPQPLTIG